MPLPVPTLLHLETDTRTRFGEPGAGRRLDTAGVEPLESLHSLKDMWWAVYLQDGAWRLHVSAGFEVRLDGRVTGGGALERGDVLDDGDGRWRFLDGEWPGPRNAALDERTLALPHDDALALVYRDWALEHGSAIAEALRRPVPRAEQARHLWSLGRPVQDGLVDADFAGPFVHRVVVREPRLELIGFVDALSACAPYLPRLDGLRTLGVSADDGVQLALLVARAPALRRLRTLEAGQRGAFWLDDFRQQDERGGARDVPTLRSPREGPARPVTLELVDWDGWTPVEPLTTARRFLLDRDTSLINLERGASLVPARADAPVTFRRLDDWVLEVRAPVASELQPRRAGVPVTAAIGLAVGEVFELVPGLRCRLTPG